MNNFTSLLSWEPAQTRRVLRCLPVALLTRDSDRPSSTSLVKCVTSVQHEWFTYFSFFFKVYLSQVWVCVSFSLILFLSLFLSYPLSLALILSSVHSSSCARVLHACDLILFASNSKFLARANRLDFGGGRIVSFRRRWRWRTWTVGLAATIQICNVRELRVAIIFIVLYTASLKVIIIQEL